MKCFSAWLLCLIGITIIHKGNCRPNADDYVMDGDADGDYDDEADEDNLPAPKMLSRSSTIEVNVNKIATLPCEVQGNPDIYSRVWRKDSKGLFVGSVAQSDDKRIALMPDGSIEIQDIQPTDAGLYNCMISSAGGRPEDVTHTLRVKSPAKILRVTPSEKAAIKEMSSLTLECIAQGYPDPSIKWFRNGHVLDDQDPSIHGARYTISNATSEDSGIYRCTATNGQQQQPDERVVEIEVHCPPQVKIARAIVPSGEGFDSELKCTVTGTRKPDLKWYKSGESKPLVNSQRIKLEVNGNDHIIRIIKTTQSDFGDYTCEAKNTEGQAEGVITLTGKPSRPELEKSVMDEAKNPLLIFRVESFSPIDETELLYRLDNKDEWTSVKPTAIAGSVEEKVFTIKHVLDNLEPGVYNARLKAKNSYGWSELSDVITFPKEHQGDLRETGLLAVSEGKDNSAAELRISLTLLVSLLVAHFYC